MCVWVDLKEYNKYKGNVADKNKGMKTTDSRTALLLGRFSEVLLNSQTFTSHPTGVQ